MGERRRRLRTNARRARHGVRRGTGHPGRVTDRDRSIAIITALTAQGVTGDRLTTHLQRAQDEGLDVDALTGLTILLAGYLGYPKASLAMETLHQMDR